MCLLLLTYQKPTKQNLIKARKFLSGFLNFLLSVVPLFHWPLTSFWQPALWAAKVNNFRRISTSVEAKFLLQQTGCLHFNVWSKAIVLSSIMSLASAGRSTSLQVWTLTMGNRFCRCQIKVRLAETRVCLDMWSGGRVATEGLQRAGSWVAVRTHGCRNSARQKNMAACHLVLSQAPAAFIFSCCFVVLLFLRNKQGNRRRQSLGGGQEGGG